MQLAVMGLTGWRPGDEEYGQPLEAGKGRKQTP